MSGWSEYRVSGAIGGGSEVVCRRPAPSIPLCRGRLGWAAGQVAAVEPTAVTRPSPNIGVEAGAGAWQALAGPPLLTVVLQALRRDLRRGRGGRLVFPLHLCSPLVSFQSLLAVACVKAVRGEQEQEESGGAVSGRELQQLPGGASLTAITAQ